jgi:hypothetical protein
MGSGALGAAVFVRRDAARPRPMAAGGRVRHCHCCWRTLRPRNRRTVRRRASRLAYQRPAACHDHQERCTGRAASGRRHRRSRTRLAQCSWRQLAARAVHPLHCRQPPARGGAASFGDPGAGTVACRRRSIAGVPRMRPPLLAGRPCSSNAAAPCCRCHTQRTPAGEIDSPRRFSASDTRTCPQAG